MILTEECGIVNYVGVWIWRCGIPCGRDRMGGKSFPRSLLLAFLILSDTFRDGKM